MDNLNRLAIITGASRGIGLAVAHAFGAIGFDLLLCARNSSNLEEIAQQIQSGYGVNVKTFAADLSNKNECQALVAFVKSQQILVDVLVNNAGVFLPGTLMEEDEDQMDFQMRTNYFSAYYVTKGVWPMLREKDRSHVFNMCSIASLVAYDAGGGYAVTKHALLGFSKSLRKEGIPRGILVSAILPGATLTDSWAGVNLPSSRFMSTADVASTVIHAWNINRTSVAEEILIRPIEGDI